MIPSGLAGGWQETVAPVTDLSASLFHACERGSCGCLHRGIRSDSHRIPL